ncbi:hypothetical protein [Guptibacillus hwajinpoensis]|uniref:hypothetical protein n=1 Tax=Guptibacillus hwajinpoensis TaxID=208199 RepID=UPI001CFEF614|nr:hypothetical protein [Pseudalkalibacillus hwajinpoensis]WLR59029.1 hypothetical protein LC071_18040 [Pseudalkalibacillus hwajinpoensis]
MLLAAEFNTGDVIFQVIAFLLLVAIPVGIVMLIILLNKRASRLGRVEAKIDRLLEEKSDRT